MRKTGQALIVPQSTFAAVVDGECEVWYLQMLKRNERSIPVNIQPKIPHKKRLADQYKTVKSLSEDYTKVFWVIDFDSILKESKEVRKANKAPLHLFSEYCQKLEKEHTNVVVIINNPCLEFWLLVHFEDTSKYFDTCAKAESQLKKYLKDYEKSKRYYTKEGSDIYLKLKPKLKIALANAKKLRKFDAGNVKLGLTEMHLLFEALLQVE